MNRSDVLLIKFQTDGEGRVTASLNGVAQELGQVEKRGDQAAKALARTEASGSKTASSMAVLKGALAGLIGIETLRRLVDTADVMANLSAKIKLVTTSEEEAIAVRRALFDVSQRTSTSLESTVTLYARMATGLRDVGASTAETIALTETINKAFAVSGATSAETASAVLQLSQALGAGALRGEEFNSVNEAAPRLMQALADSLGVTRGELRGMAEEGKLTADVIRKAFSGAQAEQIAEEYSQLPITVGRAFQQLKNAMSTTVSDLNEVTGATSALAREMAGLAASMPGFIEWATGNINASEQYARALEDLNGEHDDLVIAIQRVKALQATGIGFVMPGLQAGQADELAELESALAEVNNRIKGYNLLAKDEQERTSDATQATVESAQATEGLSAAKQAQIAKLNAETEALGRSKVQKLEHAKADALMAETSEEVRAAITANFDAKIKLAKAETDATTATRAGTAASKEAAKARREQAALDREAAEQLKRLEQGFEDVWDAAAPFEAGMGELAETLDDLNAAYQLSLESLKQYREDNSQNIKLVGEIDAAIARLTQRHVAERKAVTDQHEPAQAMLDQMREELGLLTKTNAERDRAQAIRLLGPEATEGQIQQAIGMFNERRVIEAEAEQAERWRDGMMDAIESVAQSMVNSFKRGGGSIEDALTDSITGALDQLANTAIKNFAREIGDAMNNNANGADGSSVAAAGGQAAIAAVGAIGASYIGGESSRGQSVLGGAAAGAAYGGQSAGAGGAIIGAIIGAIVGYVAYQKPVLEVSSSSTNIDHGRVEGQSRSVLGQIYVGKDDLTLAGNMQSQELAELIRDFDNTIAGFLSAADIEASRAALRNFDFEERGHGLNPQNVLEERFRAIVQAIEPEWVRFLGTIDDLEERIAAFQGLRAMRDQVESLDELIASIGGDPFASIRFAIHNLTKAVDDGEIAFEAALAAKDPVAIVEASAQLSDAVMRRYQAEMDMVLRLADLLASVEREARTFNFDIAQRIAGVGGDPAAVTQAAANNLLATVDNYANAADAEVAMQHLNEFIATVDQWLQSSRNEVAVWHAEQTALLAARLTALDAEYQGITDAAAARLEAESQYQAQVQAIHQAELDAERERLQALLRTAQAFVGVLDQAQGLLDALSRGSANPLGASARFDAYNTELADLQRQRAGASEADRAAIDAQIITLLNDRLTLGGEIYDRASDEYLALYNQTLRDAATVRDDATDPAARALALQEQLNALTQGTTDAVVSFASQSANYTDEERLRLDEIETERAAIAEAQRLLDVEQAARLAAIDEEARSYYTWAQNEGQAVLQRRHDELTAALNEITGGVAVQEYLTSLTEQTVDTLGQIRDRIDGFLQNVVEGSPNGGYQHPPIDYEPGGGGPRDPLPPREVPLPNVTIGEVHVHTTSNDPVVLGREVVAAIRTHASQIASTLKPELRTA